MWSTWGIGDGESAADALGEEVGDLDMPGYGLGVPCLRIFPKRVFPALGPHDTSVAA